jgi:DNA-binding response OmpR family regulator
VDALLRRTRGTLHTSDRYCDGAIEIDFAGSRVALHGAPVALTPLEFRLLSTFVRHPGQILSREQIIELAWSDPINVSTDQVKLYVGYLRAKIGTEHIETVRGFGYRYLAAA